MLHHLTDETLQDYSSGVLNTPMETLVACHLTVCPECRRRAALADAIGGLSLNDEPSATVQASAAQVLAMDNSVPAAQHQSTKPAALPKELSDELVNAGVPRPLARLLPAPIEQLPWKSFGPSMKQYNLSTLPRKEGAFKLMSLAPGSRMSKHSHNHRELTFIISGSYSDEMGQFRAGDIADLSAEHHHTPHVDSDVPCISLIATDAPVKFDGLFGRMIQPFVGI